VGNGLKGIALPGTEEGLATSAGAGRVNQVAEAGSLEMIGLIPKTVFSFRYIFFDSKTLLSSIFPRLGYILTPIHVINRV